MGIKRLLQEVQSKSKLSKNKVVVGQLSAKIIDFVQSQGVEVHTQEVYINAKTLAHTVRRSKKERGAGLSEEDILRIPEILAFPVAVYFDDSKKKLNLLYCATSKCQKVIKIVVDTKYIRKKEKYTLVKTAGYVEWANMGMYKMIIGAESR